MHDTRPSNVADPLAVAEIWATRLGSGSLDDLMEMYGPKAPLHTAIGIKVGRDSIREFWEGSPLLNGAEPEKIVRANGVSVVRWSVPARNATVASTELLIRGGRIVEQWMGEALLTENVLGSIPVEFSHSGGISDGDRQGAIEAMERALEGMDEPVVHVRIRMEHSADRNKDRATSLRAVVDIKGGAIRADVSGDTAHAAIDALESRVRAQVRDRSARRHQLLHRGAGDGTSWRHGDVAPSRPDYYPRPPEDREIVRHKSMAPVGSNVEEALFDLDSMDYDFYLFTAASTGREALVWRDEQRESFVVRFAGGKSDDTVVPDGVIHDERDVPQVDLRTARERLDVGREPFVFFIDSETERGHVLYRRYDGHYGVIVPIDAPD